MSRPTAADAQSRLSYDPDTGALVRLAFTDTRGKFHRERPVRVASAHHRHIQVSLFGHPYLAHRVIYLIVTGRWPRREIDHINGDPTDNRWSNIRPASRSQNNANKGRDLANTSGYKGVYLCGFTGLWRARIKFKGKSTCLGRFTSPKAAHAAYARAARRIYGKYARAE